MRNVLWLFLLSVLQGACAQDCARILPVNVLSTETLQALAFQPERLRVRLGNTPVAISKFEKIKGNRILILIDIRSMEDKSLQELSDLILQKVPSDSSFACGFFSDDVFLSDGFSDADGLAQALRRHSRQEIKGKTVLYDALDRALRLFQEPTPGDSILLISDGEENGSQVHATALRKKMMESGVRLFGIAPTTAEEDPRTITSFAPGVVSEPLPSQGTLVDPYGATERDLREVAAKVHFLYSLAEESGGAVYPLVVNQVPWSVKKWRGPMLESIQKFWLEVVGGGYQMTINLPPQVADASTLKLQLDKSGDKSLERSFVTYPQRLAACSSTAVAAH